MISDKPEPETTTVLCALIGTATVLKAGVASKCYTVGLYVVTPDATSEGSPRMMIIIFLVWMATLTFAWHPVEIQNGRHTVERARTTHQKYFVLVALV